MKTSVCKVEECCNLNEVVESYYSELKGYLINQTKDPELSEELLQEIMLKATLAHRKGVSVENIRAWFYTIARTTLLDHFRKLSAEAKLKSHFSTSELPDDNNMAELSVLIDKYMKPMISLLPEKYSIPLILADLENIPQKSVAEKLGLSLTAVKSRVQRARKHLLELFWECCNVETDKNGNFISCTLKNNCEVLNNIK